MNIKFTLILVLTLIFSINLGYANKTNDSVEIMLKWLEARPFPPKYNKKVRDIIKQEIKGKLNSCLIQKDQPISKREVKSIAKKNVGPLLNAFMISAIKLQDKNYPVNNDPNISAVARLSWSLSDKYPWECWDYLQPMITDTNILTSPSGEILGYAISFNLTNQIMSNKEKFNEFLQAYRDVHPFYNRGYKGSVAILGRIGLILNEAYKTLTLDELEVLIKNEPYRMLSSRMLNEIRSHRPCEKGYQIYAEYYPKSCNPGMAKWKVKRNVRHFREYVDKMEG